MRKIVSYFVILFVTAGLIFFGGCAKQTQIVRPAKIEMNTPAPVIEEKAILTGPGFYKDKNLGISLEYPANVFTVENELKSGEVLNREGAQRVPAIVLRVNDIRDGVVLEKIGETIKNDFKNGYPDSEILKLVENKMIKLESGINANYSLVNWKYQGSIPLMSACVSVYKKGKEIQIIVTSIPGQPPVEILTKMAMLLEVTL